MFDVLEFIGEKCHYDWIEARNALAQYLERWFDRSEEQRMEYQAILDKFAPKKFYDKLTAFIKDNHSKIGDNYLEFAKKMEERMMPLAQEFIDEKIYEQEDFVKLLTDKQLYNNWFIKDLAALSKDCSTMAEIFTAMSKAVFAFKKEYAENFIPNYISFIGDNEVVRKFIQNIESAGYCRLSASILGVLDKTERPYLAHVMQGYHDGQYDDVSILQYLRRYYYQSIDDVLLYLMN